MSHQPFACTLAPDDRGARLALIKALSDDALLQRTATARGLSVRLRDSPETERRVRELVAAESRCCAFLEFSVRRDGAGLVLEIAGPEEARPVIETFFAPDAA